MISKVTYNKWSIETFTKKKPNTACIEGSWAITLKNTYYALKRGLYEQITGIIKNNQDWLCKEYILIVDVPDDKALSTNNKHSVKISLTVKQHLDMNWKDFSTRLVQFVKDIQSMLVETI